MPLLLAALAFLWLRAADRDASLELVAPADVVAEQPFAVILRQVKEPAAADQRAPLVGLRLAWQCDDAGAQLPAPSAIASEPSGRAAFTFALKSPGIHRVRLQLQDGEVVSNAIRCHSAPPQRVLLFGDLHGHEPRIAHHMDAFTDARIHALALEQEYVFAREIGCVDFIALTPHHQIGGGLARALADGGTLWQRALALGDEVARTGLVVLPAYELQTAEGDHNVYFRSLHDAPIAVANSLVADLRLPPPGQALVNPHPVYLQDPWFYPSAYERLVEVLRDWNNYEPWVTRALEDGWHLAFVGGSDNHRGAAGSQSLTAVLARERSVDAVFDALYERRTYATNGERIVLDFTVNDAPMGALIESDSAPRIDVHVSATCAAFRVEILRNRDVIAQQRFTTREAELHHVDLEFALAATDNTYYRVRVEQEARTRGPQGGRWPNQQALSSPIWVAPDRRVASAWVGAAFDVRDHDRVIDAIGTWYRALLATKVDPNRCLAAQNIAALAWDIDDGELRNVLALADRDGRVRYAGHDAILSELPAPRFAADETTWPPAVTDALAACDRAQQELATIRSATQPRALADVRQRMHQTRSLLQFELGYMQAFASYQQSLVAWMDGDEAGAASAALATRSTLAPLDALLADLDDDDAVHVPLDVWRASSVRSEARALLARAKVDLDRTWIIDANGASAHFARALSIGRGADTAPGLRRIAAGAFDLNASYVASCLPRTARTDANDTQLLANCGFEPWRDPELRLTTPTSFAAATTPIVVRVTTDHSGETVDLHYARGASEPGVVQLTSNAHRVAMARLGDFAPAPAGTWDFRIAPASVAELAVFAPRSSGTYSTGWVRDFSAAPVRKDAVSGSSSRDELVFTTTDATDVELRVRDEIGRLVAPVVAARVTAGTHRYPWRAPTSGVYRCELRASLSGYDVERVVDTKLPVRANSFEPAIAIAPASGDLALLTTSLNRFTRDGVPLVQGPILPDALLDPPAHVDALVAFADGTAWAAFAPSTRVQFATDGTSTPSSEDHARSPCPVPIGSEVFVARDDLGSLYTLPAPRARPTFAMTQIVRKRASDGTVIGTFRVDVPVAGRPDPKAARADQAFAVRDDGWLVFPCGRPYQFPREWRANGMDLAFLKPRYEQVLECTVEVR